MRTRPGYSPEVRERVVRLALTTEHEHSSRWAAQFLLPQRLGVRPKFCERGSTKLKSVLA